MVVSCKCPNGVTETSIGSCICVFVESISRGFLLCYYGSREAVDELCFLGKM